MAGMIGCLKKGCDKVRRGRGLCISHYHALAARVHAGEITWEQAEKRGLCQTMTPRRECLRRFANRG